MSGSAYDAIIVGSGPNGLTAAARLAMAGYSVCVFENANEFGGGTRTSRDAMDGYALDTCSSVHPFGAASPAFRALGLEDHGLEWLHAPIALAHPLDGGRAAVLDRDHSATTGSLASDGARWRRRFGFIERHWDALVGELFAPVLRIPSAPFALARFGVSALRPATKLSASFDGEAAQALFAGLAAHSALPLDRLQTSGAGLMLGAAVGTVGWPVAAGGSDAIARSLASVITSNGGEIITGHRVRSLGELPSARALLFDTSPRGLADICADALPKRYLRRLLKFRHGAGAFKIDYALREPIAWTAAACRSAGTLHLGGSMLEIAAAEAIVASGSIAERPYVLVGQSSLADASRAPAGRHCAWAYCHVPQGVDLRDSGDVIRETIESQIERFAPGFRDVVIERRILGPSEFEAHNSNLHGGDFGGGAADGMQLLFRPTGVPSLDPYRTPAPHVYICSASTPPGAGVHGMCGWNAAGSALRHSLGG